MSTQIVRQISCFAYGIISLQVSSGESNTDSPTAVLLFVFSLSSSACASKPSSSAQKSKAKILAVGCTAVLAELLFVKSSKITQEIPVGIFKGFSAELAESSLLKTYRGTTPHCLRDCIIKHC